MRNNWHHDLEEKIRNHRLLMPLDTLLVGGTGTGKSSTINALFGTAVAKVGDGVDPETKRISSYKLNDYLRIHDSAGLGDGKTADLEHAKNIVAELRRLCTEKDVDDLQYGFIDLVVVLLDGGSRDLGTAFKLLETVVLRSIEPNRVAVVINQADLAMKGRYWDKIFNKPGPELKLFLDEKARSVKKRIKESTGLTIATPVYYSAIHRFNIDAVVDHIISHVPNKRRVLS